MEEGEEEEGEEGKEKEKEKGLTRRKQAWWAYLLWNEATEHLQAA
jgi:hypothetical protein